MSELGDLLELIFTARKSFRTFQATVRNWRDEEAQAEARRRHHSARGAGSVVSLGPRSPAAPETERFSRIWVQPPSRSRYESYHRDGEPRLTKIVNGDRFWTNNLDRPLVVTNVQADQTVVASPQYTRYYQDGKDIYDPSNALLMVSLEPLGRATHAGREAIRVKAWPKDDIDPNHPLSELLWAWADEYELLVDAERGSMLRVAAWIDGRQLMIREVTQVVFDETIPDDIFEFTPPPGVKIQYVG